MTDYKNYVHTPHTATSLNYRCLNYLNHNYHYHHHYRNYNHNYQQILSWIIRNYSDLTDYKNYVLAPHTAASLNYYYYNPRNSPPSYQLKNENIVYNVYMSVKLQFGNLGVFEGLWSWVLVMIFFCYLNMWRLYDQFNILASSDFIIWIRDCLHLTSLVEFV